MRCRRWLSLGLSLQPRQRFETLEAGAALAAAGGAGPERENTLRSALATSMFGLNALDIENLNQDEQAWDALVEEFSGYRQIWRQRGVMPMLRALMSARHIAENLLATAAASGA
jgi:exodeoxyribonuclease V beta subunit